jgi:hypothetical protein
MASGNRIPSAFCNSKRRKTPYINNRNLQADGLFPIIRFGTGQRRFPELLFAYRVDPLLLPHAPLPFELIFANGAWTAPYRLWGVFFT